MNDETIARLRALWDAFTEWRIPKCTKQGWRGWKGCVGENHVEDCPDLVALQDCFAIHNKGLP